MPSPLAESAAKVAREIPAVGVGRTQVGDIYLHFALGEGGRLLVIHNMGSDKRSKSEALGLLGVVQTSVAELRGADASFDRLCNEHPPLLQIVVWSGHMEIDVAEWDGHGEVSWLTTLPDS